MTNKGSVKTEKISKAAGFTKAGMGMEVNPAYNLFEEDSFSLYRKVRLWLLSELKIAHKKWARQINDHGN